MNKWVRTIGVVASAGLIAGALVGGVSPAQAAKKCKKFKPASTFASDSEAQADAAKAKVKKITDKYTSKKPLTISYTHGPAFWLQADPEDPTAGQRPAVEDTKWFNFQVDSKKKFVGLYLRQEWAATPVSDMDLYLYDRNGNQAAVAGDLNQAEGTPLDSGTGGPGYEEISGLGVKDCSGYTAESRAFTSPGESMTLKVWLGPVK